MKMSRPRILEARSVSKKPPRYSRIRHDVVGMDHLLMPEPVASLRSRAMRPLRNFVSCLDGARDEISGGRGLRIDVTNWVT